jgi:protein-L-isoaspartate(D-aspartate) O-methyltransferase
MVTRAQIEGIGMTSQRTRNRLVDRLRDKGIADERVLATLARVPRHLFVDEAIAHRAYEDTALPIGYGQTISQPYIVALMTEALLGGGSPKRVLDVGTGSGYQAAVLSQLVDEVFTVERIGDLLGLACERFAVLGYDNIHARHSDGGWGWPEYGPYDGIVVAAAPERVPMSLYEQLAIGGRLVIPIGGQTNAQQLTVVTRHEQGLSSEVIEAVRFVPFLGGCS